MKGLNARALVGRVHLLKNRLASSIDALRNARWTKYESLSRYLALAGVLLVMFLRAPHFFLTPRIWAEEGTYFFSNAYHYAHTSLWYKGIFYELGGYLNLWANLASTVAANCVSIENVPYVTLLFAVVVQLIPFVIVLWSDSPFWLSPARKMAGILILLFAPLSGEVWLNTIQSQVFFTLAVFLLLMENIPTTAVKRWGYRLVLLFGGLTGPGACVATPFFLLEAWKEKNKERLIQGVILSLCAAVQGLLMCLFPCNTRHASEFDPAVYLLSLWSQSMGLVLLGVDRASHFGQFFFHLYKAGNFWFLPTTLACAIVIGLIVVFLAKAVPPRDRLVLVGMYFLLSFVSCFGALDEESGKCDLLLTGFAPRYYFVPNVIFLLLILSRCRGPMRFGRVAATAVLVVSISLGMGEYRKTQIGAADWPKWEDEVRTWRENPTHKIAVWPPGWHVQLR